MRTLNKLITWPGYYALIATIVGCLVSLVSWLVAQHNNSYAQFIANVDISWLTIASAGAVIISLFSLSLYDKFTGRRQLKMQAFINNERMMWQAFSFLAIALIFTFILLVIKTTASFEFITHISIWLNAVYSVCVYYFAYLYVKMLFTNR